MLRNFPPLIFSRFPPLLLPPPVHLQPPFLPVSLPPAPLHKIGGKFGDNSAKKEIVGGWAGKLHSSLLFNENQTPSTHRWCSLHKAGCFTLGTFPTPLHFSNNNFFMLLISYALAIIYAVRIIPAAESWGIINLSSQISPTIEVRICC